MSEGIGYLFQALGLFVYALLCKKNHQFPSNKIATATIIVFNLIFCILSSFINNGLLILLFGFLMNLTCGMLSGYSLVLLAIRVPKHYRGRVMGIAYSIGSIGSWLLSIPMNGNFLASKPVHIAYLLLAVICILIARYKYDDIKTENTSVSTPDKSLIVVAVFLVILLSLVNTLGSLFPMGDIESAGFNMEYARAFYAIGLIIAGFINDMDRRFGAVACIAALIIPFILLFITGNASATLFVCITEFIFTGFFTVYRAVLFCDMSSDDNKLLFIATFGILFGRIGDAISTIVTNIFLGSVLPVAITAAILFVVTIFIFYNFSVRYYFKPDVMAQKNKIEKINEFCEKYDFSPREKEVFTVLLKGLSNSDISSELFISENTVKFHIKNILKKTECSNRTELISKFSD